mmetsp:Transcript_36316/g.41754  ORF Transcript_36316/g.41754 Transcript_36316/m.41754 type:complete len:457 (+) Transcript_36316:149-1519(+)
MSSNTCNSDDVTVLECFYTKKLNDVRKKIVDIMERSDATNNAHTFVEEQAKKEHFKHLLHTFVVYNELTPQRLASSSAEHRNSVSRLLHREDNAILLEEMLIADGATNGNYGTAYDIYQDIQAECEEDNEKYPILHRLAVAISIVHATPVTQTNPKEQDEESEEPPETIVDPVRRYLNYAAAYLAGELDPAFDSWSIFELTFVVNGDEPDEISAWGRSTLRNYYPDHVTTSINNPDNTFLYGGIVQTDVPYGSSRVTNDVPTQQKYQNILMNGGICGRRAFFGRFMLRAFGIPTTARPSKGHAALCHAMPSNSNPPSDWEVNLGGKWSKGWTNTKYVKDLDFLATTKARTYSPVEYYHVKMAQWLGDVLQETSVYGLYDPTVKGRGQNPLLDPSTIGFWYHVSLMEQQAIITRMTTLNLLYVSYRTLLVEKDCCNQSQPSPKRSRSKTSFLCLLTK